MKPVNQIPKSGKPKLTLKNIQTKSRFLADQESGNTPLTCLTTSETLQASCETLEAFNEKYELLEKIGQGANGVVFKCLHKKKIFAVKKSKTEIETIPHLKASYNQTKLLEHESIIHYKGLYIAPQKRVSYLVMQYFEHRELCNVKVTDMNQISDIAYQLLEAVAYMHEKNVCHRDIKPDNILYDKKNRKIKLTDFGESKAIKQGRMVKQMMTCTGTLQYKAPQLFRGGVYDQLIDQWAVGVTIYELLTGKKPFDSEYKATIIDNIENCRVSFEEQFWGKHPGRWAKQLIERLLCPRESRITAAQAMKNLWFKGHASALKSITLVKPEKNQKTNLELSLAIKDRDVNQKERRNSLNKWIQVTGEKMINSQEQFFTDEDDEVVEPQNSSKKNQQLNEIVQVQKKKQGTNSSTECKSPLYKEQEELKSPLTQSSSVKGPKQLSEKQYSKQC